MCHARYIDIMGTHILKFRRYGQAFGIWPQPSSHFSRPLPDPCTLCNRRMLRISLAHLHANVMPSSRHHADALSLGPSQPMPARMFADACLLLVRMLAHVVCAPARACCLRACLHQPVCAHVCASPSAPARLCARLRQPVCADICASRLRVCLRLSVCACLRMSVCLGPDPPMSPHMSADANLLPTRMPAYTAYKHVRACCPPARMPTWCHAPVLALMRTDLVKLPWQHAIILTQLHTIPYTTTHIAFDARMPAHPHRHLSRGNAQALDTAFAPCA